MKKKPQWLKACIVWLVLSAVTALGILVAVGLPLYLHSLPALSPWHAWHFTREFTSSSPVRSFDQYLNLEDELFTELNRHIARSNLPPDPINRFNQESISYPGSPDKKSQNWNRTFELMVPKPRAGVLLLHGMSDSPYSLRSIGLKLQQDHVQVLGLRLPGHGTAPSGLVHTTWQDLAQAVTLGLTHLNNQVPNRPLYIIGYSTGGALGIHHLLSRPDPELAKRVKGLILISPALGVSPLASLAVWKKRFSRLPGCKKLAWVDIQPEYNPYKYNSFPTNAGEQVFRLTREIQKKISASTPELLTILPPILTFQSIVDATVSTNAVVKNLFDRVPKSSHELVIFDINRLSGLTPLISKISAAAVEELIQRRELPYTLTIVTNRTPKTRKMELRIKWDSENRTIPLDLSWPREIYSLSHVALPFSETDPLYGRLQVQHADRQVDDPTILNLGDVVPRGERGMLKIPASDLLRLKWNPFYPYLEKRILNFIQP